MSIKLFIKKLGKSKNTQEIVEACSEFIVNVNDISMDCRLLYLKEVCRDTIYSKEKSFKTVDGKNGALKMDSVLNTIKLECFKLNYEYNEDYWKDYISREVSSMKEVK